MQFVVVGVCSLPNPQGVAHRVPDQKLLCLSLAPIHGKRGRTLLLVAPLSWHFVAANHDDVLIGTTCPQLCSLHEESLLCPALAKETVLRKLCASSHIPHS
jgi:hypothetical protein